MAAELQVRGSAAWLSRRRSLALLGATATWLSGCSGTSSIFNSKDFSTTPTAGSAPDASSTTIGAGQSLERAQRDVAEIADRGRDDVQPGRKRRRLERNAGHHVAALRGRLRGLRRAHGPQP